MSIDARWYTLMVLSAETHSVAYIEMYLCLARAHVVEYKEPLRDPDKKKKSIGNVNSQGSMPYLPAGALRKGTMEFQPWPRQLRLEVKYKFATCGT